MPWLTTTASTPSSARLGGEVQRPDRVAQSRPLRLLRPQPRSAVGVRERPLLAGKPHVAAWSAPTVPYQHPKHVPLDVFEPSTPTHVLTSYVPRFTYLDPRLASNPAIMKRLKPCLAAGVKMCSAYSYAHADRLPCNITALSGSNDLFAPPGKMAGWADIADRKYKYCSKVYAKHWILVNRHYLCARILCRKGDCRGNNPCRACVMSSC